MQRDKTKTKRKKVPGLILVIAVIIIAVAVWFAFSAKEEERTAEENNVIRLAFVGPMSGEGRSEGRLMSQALKLYLEQYNEAGGLNGMRVELDIFDDMNNAEEARRQAQRIAEENSHLAVIGHWYSSASVSGGEVYKEHEIPAVTPGSVDPQITEDNPWYFRSIYNANLPARFLANYIDTIMDVENVSIIYDTDAYGLSMALPFMNEIEKIDLNLKYKWHFNSASPDKEEQIARIVEELSEVREDAGTVFVPVYAEDAVRIVKRIKDLKIDNQIIGPSSFSEDTFIHGFEDFPKEVLNPGHYTNNILVLVPLLFEVANREAQIFLDDFTEQYGSTPSWASAFAYDSANVLLTSALMAGISGDPGQLQDDREKLRDYMADLRKPEDAIPGITGLNYFDNQRNAQKPITLCQFRNNHLTSALVQLQSIQNPGSIYRLEEEQGNGRVVLIDDQYMYKTEIIYTGMEISGITDFNPVEKKHTVHFDIWFRYQGDFDPEDLEFVNALEPVELGEPVEREIGEINYLKYSTKGVFSIDYLEKPDRYNEHALGLSIKHSLLDRYNIIFIPDLAGMYIDKAHSYIDKLLKKNIAVQGRDWSFSNAFLYQEMVQEHSKGNPRYLNYPGSTADFSQLNFSVIINRSGFDLGDFIPAGTEIYVVLLTFVLLIVSVIMYGRNNRRNNMSLTRLFFVVKIPFFAAFLMSLEIFLANMAIRMGMANITMISMNFSVIWYLLAAYLGSQAVTLFVWKPIERKTGKEIPKVLKQVVAFIIYAIAFFLVVAFVLQREVTALVATSGVLTAVVGLAIQANISDIFSGIAINMESPFQVGDWIKVGSDEGKVIDITWRTTRIQNGSGNMVMIPNSNISGAVIMNYHMPQSKYWFGFTVHVSSEHRPDEVEKLLQDAVSAVKEVEEPWVIFTGLTDWSADYWVYFWIENYGNRFTIQNRVWIKVWTVLNRAGIKPAIKQQDIHMYKGIRERIGDKTSDPYAVLNDIDIFKPFSDEDKRALAGTMKPEHYITGESIVSQGDEGDSMFIITEGVVSIEVHTEDGKNLEVARLSVGDFFGEMSLLTGCPRTATVRAMTSLRVFEITKSDINPLIQKNSDISEKLSQVLTERKMSTQQAVESSHKNGIKEKKETMYKNILKGIKNFFGISKKESEAEKS